MATRKSGDGSRGANDGERPGGYAKVTGARKKRRGKRARDSVSGAAPTSATASAEPPQSGPPGSAGAQAGPDDLDERAGAAAGDVGDEDDALQSEEEGAPQADEEDAPQAEEEDSMHTVDDLRRARPASSPPRRGPGPLGMEDARSASSPAASAAAESLSPLAAAHAAAVRLNVIEINAPELASDNTNHEVQRPASVPSAMDAGWTRARPSDVPTLDELRANDAHREGGGWRSEAPPDDDDAWRSEAPRARRSEASASSSAAMDRDERESDGGIALRQPVSSVLEARFSIRPSPPPPPDRPSIGWWIVVSLLSLIILAAGVVALREALEEPSAKESPRAPPAAPVRPVAKQPVPVPPPPVVAAPVDSVPAPPSPLDAALPSDVQEKPAPPPLKGRRLPMRPGMAPRPPAKSPVVPGLPRNPYDGP